MGGSDFKYDPLHTGSNRLASISVKTLHLGARAHGQLVCAAALRSYEKLRHVGDQLVYEAQLLRVKTFCRRSFFVQLAGKSKMKPE